MEPTHGTRTRPVAVGDRAPDFTLPSQDGEPVTLSDLFDDAAVVLYFYPKDNSPGCTAEACAFRDSHVVFAEAGAQVIGVSSDSAESHAGFAATHGLPFTLLSDRDGRVRRLYGVRKTMGLLPGRVTYVIDRAGIVRHVFSSQLNATTHAREALAIVESLRSTSASAG